MLFCRRHVARVNAQFVRAHRTVSQLKLIFREGDLLLGAPVLTALSFFRACMICCASPLQKQRSSFPAPFVAQPEVSEIKFIDLATKAHQRQNPLSRIRRGRSVPMKDSARWHPFLFTPFPPFWLVYLRADIPAP